MSLKEYKKELKNPRVKSKKVRFNGFEFDSLDELDVYKEYLEDPEWDILEVHPKFELQEKFSKNGKTHLPITWTSDLKIRNRSTGVNWIIEVKSIGTLKANSKSYPMRRKLFLHRYFDFRLKEIIFDGKKRTEKVY